MYAACLATVGPAGARIATIECDLQKTFHIGSISKSLNGLIYTDMVQTGLRLRILPGYRRGMTTWNNVADAYSRSFGTLCSETVDLLLDDTEIPDKPELTHLDVGCGTGHLAEAACARGRTVTAVDTGPDMVSMTRRRVRNSVRVLEATVLDLPFADDTFDVTTANFVVNHLSDPRSGVREIGRTLRPGGHAALTIWPATPPGWAPLVTAAFTAGQVTPLPTQPLPEHLDFDRSVGGLAEICGEAGLDVVDQRTVTWDWQVSPDNLWAGVSGGVATPGRTFLAQDTAVQQAVKEAFVTHAADSVESDGLLHLPSSASYVLATKP